MKIIISGGLGYVGGRLSKYLCEQGHSVVALSRQVGSLPSVWLPQNLKLAHPNTALVDLSLLKGSDVFIHLAALNENDCVKYPEKAIEVNITQTLRWLDKSCEAGIKKFVYFSTAHVYGKPLDGQFDEQTVAQPVHPYAITHKCAEDYVLAYATERGMDNIVIRLTNAFGGPAFPTADRWTLLVNDLCRSAVEKGSMTLTSDGTQLRDFIGLDCVCSATSYLIHAHSGHKNGIYNVSSGISMSVWDMAVLIRKNAEDFLQKPISLVRKELEHNSIKPFLIVSNQKLTKKGFVFTENMDEEIKSTLNYFSNNNLSAN